VELASVLWLLALGGGVGFIAGLMGVGGGMLIVPFMAMILASTDFPKDLIVHVAIATSLATIMFTSMSSIWAHHRHGAVKWPIVKIMAPGILLGSWIGPWIGQQLSDSSLALFFSLFATIVATEMLVGKKPTATRELPGSIAMLSVGGVIGILSGLIGAGGGFLSVPFMTSCNVKINNAVATSAALGLPIAIAGTLSNVFQGQGFPGLPLGSLGFVYMPGLVAVSAASVLTAPLGARAAHRVQHRTLKMLFSIMLYALAAYMMWRACI